MLINVLSPTKCTLYKKTYIGYLNKVHLVGDKTLISEKIHGDFRIKKNMSC
jgi:hypothetical protein